MIDEKLTIFGGADSITHKVHNSVKTYNNETNTWNQCYPNMLKNREKPGVITYHDHVIIMGGMSSPDTFLDSIEILNYHHHPTQWKEVPIKLPTAMWGIIPTLTGKVITIVGYTCDRGQSAKYYQIAADELIASLDQPLPTSAAANKWKKIQPAPHFNTATVPYSNPPVIIGGSNANGDVSTSDVALMMKTRSHG